MGVFDWAKHNLVDPVENFFTGQRPHPDVGDGIQQYGLDPSKTTGGPASPYTSLAAGGLTSALIRPMPDFGGAASGLMTTPTPSTPEAMFKPNTLSLTSLAGGDKTDPTNASGTGGMSDLQKAALIAQIAGVGAGIYGQYEAGREKDKEAQQAREDHDRKLRERDEAAKKLSPMLAKYLKQVGATQMES